MNNQAIANELVRMAKELTAYGPQPWTFGKEANNVENKLDRFLKASGMANRTVAGFARVASRPVDLNDYSETNAMSEQITQAKNSLQDMQEAMAALLNAIEEYHDEFMFRVRNPTQVTIRDR